MRIVSISDDLLDALADCDREFMQKHGRPCLLILRLRFRGKRRDFAVPFRSNISPNTPKWQYFPLPPRPTTKPKYRHGIHYIKMFPVEKRFQQKFRTEGNEYYETIWAIVDANAKVIVEACQQYLDAYEREGRPLYAVDIDKIIQLMEQGLQTMKTEQGEKEGKFVGL